LDFWIRCLCHILPGNSCLIKKAMRWYRHIVPLVKG
jgi:hypothetical protein